MSLVQSLSVWWSGRPSCKCSYYSAGIIPVVTFLVIIILCRKNKDLNPPEDTSCAVVDPEADNQEKTS